MKSSGSTQTALISLHHLIFLLQKQRRWTEKPTRGLQLATCSACTRSICLCPAVRASTQQWRRSSSTTCWSACPWTKTTSRTRWWISSPIRRAATAAFGKVAARPSARPRHHPKDGTCPAGCPRFSLRLRPRRPVRICAPTWMTPTASITRVPPRAWSTGRGSWPTLGPCGDPGRLLGFKWDPGLKDVHLIGIERNLPTCYRSVF